MRSMQEKYTALFRKLEVNGKTYYKCDFVVPEFIPNERFDSLHNRLSSTKSKFYITATEEQFNKIGVKPNILFYESDGLLYFGEINLRYGGSGYAYSALGVNLPAMLVRTLCGESIEGMPDTVTKEATYVNERVCIDDWVSGTLSKQDMHRIINSADIRFVYDIGDPEPQRQLMRYIRLLAIKRVLKKYI